jgi:hypothetical protein
VHKQTILQAVFLLFEESLHEKFFMDRNWSEFGNVG